MILKNIKKKRPKPGSPFTTALLIRLVGSLPSPPQNIISNTALPSPRRAFLQWRPPAHSRSPRPPPPRDARRRSQPSPPSTSAASSRPPHSTSARSKVQHFALTLQPSRSASFPPTPRPFVSSIPAARDSSFGFN